MQEVQFGDVEASLSTVIDQARDGNPSIITRNGRREAVLLSFEEWEVLSRAQSFERMLLSCPLQDGDLPERDQTGLRDPGF